MQKWKATHRRRKRSPCEPWEGDACRTASRGIARGPGHRPYRPPDLRGGRRRVCRGRGLHAPARSGGHRQGILRRCGGEKGSDGGGACP